MIIFATGKGLINIPRLPKPLCIICKTVLDKDRVQKKRTICLQCEKTK